MTDHLAFEILRYYPNIPTDNHFNGIGLHGVYDSKFDRVIITKIDYIPLDKDIKYDAELNQFYIETEKNGYTFRTDLYLTDTDFFCNKSWTISFNFNTKTWVSFHSYIPNFYIGENNFFYSGINGCCSDLEGEFSALVGRDDRVMPTTTTTTTILITTTTTTIFIDCDLVGEVVEVSCDLDGSAIVTVPPTTTTTVCSRPSNLQKLRLYIEYEITSPPSFNFTANLDEACSAMYLMEFGTDSINPIFVESSVLDPTQTNVNPDSSLHTAICQIVYSGIGTDCTFIKDGYYFTTQSMFDPSSDMYRRVIHIVNGTIVDIELCDCGPTTSTTTTMPVIDECCGILFAYSDSVFYNGFTTDVVQLNIPGFSASLGVAMTQYKFWSVLSTFEEWDITLSSFTATYNRSIAFPPGFSTGAGIAAIDDQTLLCVDDSTTPQEVSIMDVSGSTGVKTLAFTLPADREAKGNPLISTNGNIVIGNLDTVFGDYYLTQYVDITGTFDFEIVIPFEPKLIFVCDCSIFVVNNAGEVYTIDDNYVLVFSYQANSGVIGGTQLGSCITRSLQDYDFTTTSTSTSTTTSTTTVP